MNEYDIKDEFGDFNSQEERMLTLVWEKVTDKDKMHHWGLLYYVLNEIKYSHKYTKELVSTNLVGIDYTNKFTFASPNPRKELQIQADFCLGCGNYTISNTLVHFDNTGIESFDRLHCHCCVAVRRRRVSLHNTPGLPVDVLLQNELRSFCEAISRGNGDSNVKN